MSDTPPVRRRRFSQIYAVPENLSDDSPRMRGRIAALMHSTLEKPHLQKDCSGFLKAELNLKFRTNATYSVSWDETLAKIEKNIFLDSITVVYEFFHEDKYEYFSERGADKRVKDYIIDVNRIFAEEHVAYWIDNEGVVHPKPDEAFRNSYEDTIKGLNGAGFTAARKHIADSDGYILQDPPNWSKAIYSVFLAGENIFKVVTNDSQLNGKKLDQRLKPLIEKKYDDPHTRRSALNLYDGFKEWVDCAHNYRHDPGDKEPTQPPEDLALAIINSGYGYVRWLASFGAPEAISSED
ncbi:hypothetical protein [Ruegeria marina]|uniref:Abortive infection C-terminus n=1 Tax=Ruegeria marina TaxID=639004 RepID=A0A1G6LHL8_9RHOB|nr:hypothetical protein [Ruegeria marina]SDC42731.1 hypothetical protein SAMN04488239_102245 [Ruegeria marina]